MLQSVFSIIWREMGRNAPEQQGEDGSVWQGCGAHLRRGCGSVRVRNGRAAPPRLARDPRGRFGVGLAEEQGISRSLTVWVGAPPPPLRSVASLLPSPRGRGFVCR